MTIGNSHNFRRVNDRLTTSGVVGPNRLKGLASEGYDVVIDLLLGGSEYAVADEARIVREQGLHYVHIPVDFQHPTLADYDRFVAALDAAAGSKIHIHCAANYRVSAFYALYAESRGLWCHAEAMTFVHDLWQPQTRPPWAAFMDRVRTSR